MEQDSFIDIQDQEGIYIVRFTHPQILSTGFEEMSKQLRVFIDENQPKKIIVDFQDVKFFSSQTLGLLLDVWRKMEKNEGILVISGINPQLYRVFKITNLDKIFRFFNDLESAKEALL
jgi:anti-sigma B factor antagonist